MRWISAVPFFAAVAFAQVPAGETWQRKEPVPASAIQGTEIKPRPVGKTQAVTQTGRCSIQLPNALTKEAATMDQKILIPVWPDAYTMPRAQVPAPPCTDVRR